jgi:hypothetical protein
MEPTEALMEWVKQTYAVVVAIEDYPKLGTAWALPGVSKQAAGFARWLTRCRKVPPENVRVFQSGGDRAAFLDLQIPEKQIGPAEASQLNLFFAELKKTWPDGRLLFIYWVGHGFVGRDGSRRLILTDAIPAQKTNLDIKQLVDLLRSDLAGTFRQQIAFIDTCARFFETLQSATDLPAGGLSRPTSREAVEQNFYFAASSGEYGTKDLFGPYILDLLGELPADQWPPDRRWMWARIDQEFEKVLKGIGAQQRPVWLEYRQGLESDGISERGVLPTLSDIQAVSQRTGFPVHHLRKLTELAVKCGQLADAKARDELYNFMGAEARLYRPAGTREDLKLDLLRLIAGVIERRRMDILVEHVKAMEGDSDEAFYFGRAARSVERVRSFWPLLAGIQLPLARARSLYKASHRLRAGEDEPSSLEEIVYVLSDLETEEPLVEFLLRAAREWQQSPFCEDLNRWLESQSNWAGILAKLQCRLHSEAHGTSRLLVAIEKNQNAWRVSRAWLWLAAADSPSELAPLGLQGDLGSDINALLNEALSAGEPVHLEVLVPEELLHLERGLLLWKSRGATLDPEELYPVVLRWQDRMAAPAREILYQSGLWKKTSALIRERLGSQRRAYWIERGCNIADFRRQFDKGEAGELIGIPLSSDGSSREELIGLICNAGLPFACWPRCGTVDLKTAASWVDALLRQHQFDEIPDAFFAQRECDRQTLENILLLWDDAQHNPYDRKYADVSQRGQV